MEFSRQVIDLLEVISTSMQYQAGHLSINNDEIYIGGFLVRFISLYSSVGREVFETLSMTPR